MSEKLNLKTIASGYLSVDDLNANFLAIEQAIDNALTRYSDQPNHMEASLDMNHNRIINVGDPVSSTDAANLRTISEYITNNIVDPSNVVIGQIPHAYLSGLATGDDHPQYHTDLRGDSRYYTQTFSDDRYAYKSHTHNTTDIVDIDTALAKSYVSTKGGTITGSLIISEELTLQGVTYDRLPKINRDTVFNLGDVLAYDNVTGEWYSLSPNDIITSKPVQSIFDVNDVVKQADLGGASLAEGQFLKYTSIGGSADYWVNVTPVFTDIDGTIGNSQLPTAINSVDFLGDNKTGLPINTNTSLAVNLYNSSKWTTLSSGSGAVGQVLGIQDNGAGGNTIGWVADVGGAETLFDLTDVVDHSSSLTKGFILSYDHANTGTWNPTWISSTMFGTNRLTNSQLPLELDYIGRTVVGREDFNIPYFNETDGMWEDLKVTDTQGDLEDQTYVLGVNANNQLRYFKYVEPPSATPFTCNSLNNCNISNLKDVSSAGGKNTILIRNAGNTEYIPIAVNNHTHSGGQITSGTINFDNLPVGTVAQTVAAGNHYHSNYVTDNSVGTLEALKDIVIGDSQLILTINNGTDTQTLVALTPPTDTSEKILTYQKNREFGSRISWEDVTSGGSGVTTLTELTDTPDSNPVATDTLMVWVVDTTNPSNTGWKWSTSSDLLANTYLPIEGGILSGRLQITNDLYDVAGLHLHSGVYQKGNIYSTTQSQYTNNILLDGVASKQIHMLGQSIHGIYMDTTNVSQGISLYNEQSGSVNRPEYAIQATGYYQWANIYARNIGGKYNFYSTGNTSVGPTEAAFFDGSQTARYGILLSGKYKNADGTENYALSTSGKIQASGIYDRNGNSLIPENIGQPDQLLFNRVQSISEVPSSSLVKDQTISATSTTTRLRIAGHSNIEVKANPSNNTVYIGYTGGSGGSGISDVVNNGVYGRSPGAWVNLAGLYVPINGTSSPITNTIEFNNTNNTPSIKIDQTLSSTITPDPTNSYVYMEDIIPNYLDLSTSNVGYQGDPGGTGTSASRGRTGFASNRTYLSVGSGCEGDFVCYNGKVAINVSGADTHIGSNLNHYGVPAGVLFNGSVVTNFPETYLNPYETILKDRQYGSATGTIMNDVRAVGAVYNFVRDGQPTGKYTAESVYWDGIRINSSGSEYMDRGILIEGKVSTGLSFKGSNMPSDANAIVLGTTVTGEGQAIAMEPTGDIQIRYKGGYIEFINAGTVVSTINMSTGVYNDNP